ncbi:MAG: hypothetical protein K2K91_11250 [Ruminococcus sp.]|nr:hypothetical protein [Ruminococcus sp.]
MNEDNYNKSPSTSTICLIAFSTFIITIIMYSFISSDAVEPKKERIPDKISFSTTESAKTTSTETYYNGWDDNISKPVNNDSTYYPENYYNIGNDIPEGYYILIYNENIDTYGDANFTIYGTPDGNDFSGSFQNSAFIKLEGHGYIAMSFCDAYPLETFSGENNPFEKSGMFRVGIDVDEGTYRIVPLYDSLPTLWTVHKDIDSIDYDSCYTDYHEDDDMEVTLHEGEILQTQFCVIEKTS